MKRGDTVTIFEDPITEQILEGQAKLIAKLATPDLPINNTSKLEHWIVEWLGSKEQSYRKILAKQIKVCR